MTLESTDVPPSVPEGFGGIMDPAYGQVHKDLYGNGDIDIPLDGVDLPEETTMADAPLPDFSYTYERIAARTKALELALSLQPTAGTDTLVATAGKFADFILQDLTS